jgi:DNA-binding transcriptional LysR family regulator
MLDWDDLRFFLALARHGTLSAAAKVLHVSQSTVGRRLNSLEATLAVRLLNRTPDGYVPTLAGLEVREKAERLEAEAIALERDVTGRDTRLRGLVRVTCAETLAAHVLAPSFAKLHAQHPDIMIELIPNPRELSLAMREADISLRMRQPEQHDLVVRRIGGIAFGIYATPEYLQDHGDLDFEDGCSGHRLIIQLDDTQEMTQSAWLADMASRATALLQTSSPRGGGARGRQRRRLGVPGTLPRRRGAEADQDPGSDRAPQRRHPAAGSQGQPRYAAHPGGADPHHGNRPCTRGDAPARGRGRGITRREGGVMSA